MQALMFQAQERFYVEKLREARTRLAQVRPNATSDPVTPLDRVRPSGSPMCSHTGEKPDEPSAEKAKKRGGYIQKLDEEDSCHMHSIDFSSLISRFAEGS